MHVTDLSLLSGQQTKWRWLKGYPVDQRNCKVEGIQVRGSYWPVPPVKTENEDHKDRPGEEERNDGRPAPAHPSSIDAPLLPSSTAASSGAFIGISTLAQHLENVWASKISFKTRTELFRDKVI